MATVSFLVALVLVSFILAIIVGFGVQLAASQFELGPIPRAFIGGFFNLFVIIALVIDFGVIYFTPILLFVYYLGTFQMGTRIGHAVGLQAPDDNDPPDVFWEMMNRYQ
ncbi:hypothetical protein [Haloarcula sp. K1]|uniref:hypothetical protein n=1 Tax=Haloarcula sp. K1 TaxID=1622207 RepID=UPI0007BC2C7E|nr:hypothetical protein [Haloarcula sp. K1]KZX46263.1 hypothetical protein AV929_15950 [Haloarcula sp. K1]